MSGICGWVGRLPDNESPEATLERMARGLPSYGDSERVAVATGTGGLCLNARKGEGHWHRDGEVCAAIEGYPRWTDPALANKAAGAGNAAALIEAYRTHGAACLSHLHGAFAVAVLDLAQRSALVAIDRSGVGAMCYGAGGDGMLVFGSTADSVAAHGAIRSTISQQSLFNFLFFVDRVPAPFVIFEEQAKLAPGQYLHATPTGRRLDFYWRIPYSEEDDRPIEVLGAEMLQKLRAAVARAAADQPPGSCGTFLSGGLDSSTVSGLLSEERAERAKTFTIGFENETFNEAAYARIVSEKFDTDHTEYYVTGEDVLDLFPKIAEIYDEPFSNHSAIPTFYCAQRARDAGVDLLLAGDGGDELFAGNTRYIENDRFSSYFRIPGMLRTGLIEPVFGALPAPAGGIVDKINNRIRVANMSVAHRMYWANIFHRVPMATIFLPEVLAEIDTESPIRLIDEIYDSYEGAGTLKRMMSVDLRITIADGDLRKVNRMCELAGVRVRYPFLDDEVVEFSARVPDRYLVRDRKLRYFFKEAVRNFLPIEVIEKKKHGFGLPIADLSDQYRPLMDFACDYATEAKRRGYFQPQFLDRLIEQHRGVEHGLYRLDIFEFVFFELWMRYHVDGRG